MVKVPFESKSFLLMSHLKKSFKLLRADSVLLRTFFKVELQLELTRKQLVDWDDCSEAFQRGRVANMGIDELQG